MLIFIAISSIAISYYIEGFGVGFIFHLINTLLLIGRLKALRVKFSKFIIFEVLGIVIPVLFALLFKRFKLVKTCILIAVRAVFMLYVKYDYENYRYFTKLYTNTELDNEDEE